MPCCWRGHGMPPAVLSQLGSINPAFEALFLPSNAGTPDVVQWFGLREALSVHPLDQIGDRFSGRGAVRVGNKGTKVVSWALLLFFRTLIRDFQLQHGGHPHFGACRPAADVHQMGQYVQLRRANSR